MPTGPTIEVLIDWRQVGFSAITNDGFETDTTGWAITAGINAAATSLTQITSDAYMGAGCASMVTTATSGSGINFDFGTTSFTSGLTYRFRVYLKSVSGSTAYSILIGSLGTSGDRASLTGTLTTSWAAYSVDWTPSGTRTDVEAIVTNNAAAVMTALVDAAEVWETINDISADVTALTFDRGTSFDGAQARAGSATLTVKNQAQKYDPENGSSVLTGILVLGRKVLCRATWAGVTYGLFYGTLTRIALDPDARLAELVFADPFYEWERFEVSLATSQTTPLSGLRESVMSLFSVGSTSQSLAPEITVPTTWADETRGVSVLEEINVATGTTHFVAPNPSTSILFRYTTVDRMTLANQTSVATWTGTDHISRADGFEYIDEALVNAQRVTAHPRSINTTGDQLETVWDAASLLPYPLAAGADVTWTVYANEPYTGGTATVTFSPVVTNTAVLTPYGRSGKLVVTNTSGTDSSVTAAIVSARPAEAVGDQSGIAEDSSSITTYGRRQPEPISSDFLVDQGDAQGLADWWVLRYKVPKARPSIDLSGKWADVLPIELAQAVTVTLTRASVSSKKYLIRSMVHQVEPGLEWETTFMLEEVPVTGSTTFQLDTASAGITDGALGY